MPIHISPFMIFCGLTLLTLWGTAKYLDWREANGGGSRNRLKGNILRKPAPRRR
jgi:hypothetical protein